MILDALSLEPMLITGSANFSDSSTKNNDENMLIIKGNTRVSDIYLGEFMRLFNHYYFRTVYDRLLKEPDSKEHNSAYLTPDDSWTDKYFKKDTVSYKERIQFSDEGEKGYSITFFDIDETLFHTTAKVLVMKNGKKVKELDNQQFNTYKLNPGEEFDFTQFRDARLFKDQSKPIEKTVKEIIKQTNEAILNGSKVALLTARQSFHDMATFKQAFIEQGISIEKIDINFAGDIAKEAGSVALAKKQIVMKYLAFGEYHNAILLDDNRENLEEFLKISEIEKDVEFKAIYINKKGDPEILKN